MQFQFHPDLTSGLRAEQADELSRALKELNDAPGVVPVTPGLSAPIVLQLASHNGVTLRFGEAEDARQLKMLWASLRVPLKEYQEVIEGIVRVGTQGGAGRYEAMDYAKKVIHDEAGELLQELLEDELELPLETARKFFTLLFLLKSEMPAHLVQYHRSHY